MDSFSDRVSNAKALHRPRLADWQRDGFASRRLHDFLALEKLPQQGVEQLEELSPKRFRRNYERPLKPFLVRQDAEMVTVDHEKRLKCGESDDGKSVRLSVKDFLRYTNEDSLGDDSPLYIFAELKIPFKPSFVAEDLFDLVKEKHRPPYRWLLIGPRRSGSCVHVDPLGTAAWNHCVVGRKRWVLFEPGTPKKIVKGTGLFRGDDEPVNYFCDILPKIRHTYSSVRPLEFIQHPGQTVYIPPGWWHAVINLDHTIAYTQNFVSKTNFRLAWAKTRFDRKTLSRRWYRRLRVVHPRILDIIADIPPLPKRKKSHDDNERKRKRGRGGG